MIRYTLLAGVFAGLVTAGAAHADPLFDNGGALTIWSADTPGANINSNTQAGSYANPLRTGTPVGTGTYTGLINFSLPSGSDTIGTFLATGGGTLTGTTTGNGLNSVLSSPNFAHASLFDFVIKTGSNTNMTVYHDDGFSIWNADNSIDLVDASGPTTLTPTSFTLAANTTYNLWYAEANGLPADLIFNVPEPMSLSLLGAAMVGVGFVTRRRASRAA